VCVCVCVCVCACVCVCVCVCIMWVGGCSLGGRQALGRISVLRGFRVEALGFRGFLWAGGVGGFRVQDLGFFCLGGFSRLPKH
jgi:hypothetical protein